MFALRFCPAAVKAATAAAADAHYMHNCILKIRNKCGTRYAAVAAAAIYWSTTLLDSFKLTPKRGPAPPSPVPPSALCSSA